MADSDLKQDVFNVPNKISAARLLLSFVFFALLPLQFLLGRAGRVCDRSWHRLGGWMVREEIQTW